MFDIINTAGTGLTAYHTWLDSIADNVANAGDITSTSQPAFHEQYVQASEIGASGFGPDGGIGQGVEVTTLPRSTEDDTLYSDPESPFADKNGNVQRADVNMSQQMGDMIMAQRAFQANAEVVTDAKTTYQAAINIGKDMG
jgi:flagellar basal-body rod protein FlgC